MLERKLLTKFRALKDKEPAPQRKQCEELSVSVRLCPFCPTAQRRDPCLLLSRSKGYSCPSKKSFLDENKIIRKLREIRPQTAGWVDRMPAREWEDLGLSSSTNRKALAWWHVPETLALERQTEEDPSRLTGQPNGQSVSSMFRDSPSLKS